jgi:signal transduction histidine kinase/CheY-like chemotaxis protein
MTAVHSEKSVSINSEEPEKLHKIIDVLVDRIERGIDAQGNGFSLFQTAILLEDKIRDRTRTIHGALQDLERANEQLLNANAQIKSVQTRLMEAIESISEGFIQFDRDDRLILFNSKFVDLWPGIGEIVRSGIAFEEMVRWTIDQGLVSTSATTPEGWLSERLRNHRHPSEPLVVRLTTGRWLQIRERRTQDGGTVGIYTDISEIKRSEELRRERELAEKSVLLQSTLDNIMQGVSVFDQQFKLVAWNDRFIDLLDLPDWLVQPGISFADFLRFRCERGDYGETGDETVAVRLELARQSKSLYAEQLLANGTALEVRRSPMPRGGFVTTYADITDRKEAAALLTEAKESLERRVIERTAELTDLNVKLRNEIDERARIEGALRVAKAEADEANLSKTRFLAAASHDLLQPLNAARLFVSALQDRQLPTKESEFVDRVDGALRGVESLLGALLDISKFDAGSVSADVVDFHVSHLLTALRHEYEPLAVQRGLELIVVPSTAVVRSDAGLLGRILRNLVSNAVRYTETGRVLVGCRHDGNQLRIEVWDTGIGIATADLDLIFAEFQQVGSPQSQKEKSYGLGLAIVKRIASILDHRIDVRSEVGKGSVFSVDVPLGHVCKAAEYLVPHYVVPREPVSGSFIAVIENDATILAGMKELLEGWGCRVLTATGSEPVVDALCSHADAPDIVVADYHLADGKNGLNAIGDIRRLCGQDIPAVVITADRSPEVIHTVREHGYPLLRKPLKPAKLRALLTHLRMERSAIR